MRFLVDAYRIIILAALALALIAGSYLLFTYFGSRRAELAGFDLPFILTFISIAVLIVLSVGAIATVISMHDRLVEMSQESRRIADALERLAYSAHQLPPSASYPHARLDHGP